MHAAHLFIYEKQKIFKYSNNFHSFYSCRFHRNNEIVKMMETHCSVQLPAIMELDLTTNRQEQWQRDDQAVELRAPESEHNNILAL